MFLFDTPAEREMVDDCMTENILIEIKERLVFQRGVLLLLKETRLFGPMIEKALEDLDFVIEQIDRMS
jgi:hypothetical protein